MIRVPRGREALVDCLVLLFSLDPDDAPERWEAETRTASSGRGRRHAPSPTTHQQGNSENTRRGLCQIASTDNSSEVERERGRGHFGATLHPAREPTHISAMRPPPHARRTGHCCAHLTGVRIRRLAPYVGQLVFICCSGRAGCSVEPVDIALVTDERVARSEALELDDRPLLAVE